MAKTPDSMDRIKRRSRLETATKQGKYPTTEGDRKLDTYSKIGALFKRGGSKDKPTPPPGVNADLTKMRVRTRAEEELLEEVGRTGKRKK